MSSPGEKFKPFLLSEEDCRFILECLPRDDNFTEEFRKDVAVKFPADLERDLL